MKNIPLRIKKILSDRTKIAQKFVTLDSELTEWMEKQGIDTSCYELESHIYGGCESIVNPKISEEVIIKFLESQLR